MDNRELNIFVEEAEKNRIPTLDFPKFRVIVDEIMAVVANKIIPNSVILDKEKVEWAVNQVGLLLDGKRIRSSARERDFLEAVIARITKKRLGVRPFIGG